MEVVRRFIDASRLMSVMTLPETFKNRRLEVIVLPAEERAPKSQEIDVKAVVESLVGAIPYTGLSLSELREERLSKYEAAN